MKHLHVLLLALVLAACTQGTDNGAQGSSSSSSSSAITYTGPTPDLTETYTNKKDGYSIMYPANFPVLTNKELNAPDYTINGTAINFPADYAPGSTLDEAMIHIGTDVTCPAIGNPEPAMLGGYDASKGTWTDAGAGNLYEGGIYMTYQNNKCYVLSLSIHSCNLGPDCGTGHSKTFQRLPMRALFDKMAASFKFL